MQIIGNCSSKLLRHKYLCQPRVYSLYYSTLKGALPPVSFKTPVPAKELTFFHF